MTPKVQGVLDLPLLAKSTTCTVCGMNYLAYLAKDKALHTKYHADFVNGPRWKLAALPIRVVRIAVAKKKIECKLHAVNAAQARLVGMVERLLEMVNRELNAPPANESWKENMQGRVFVFIIDDKVVGLCVTEPIVDAARQARWMVHRTQEIVPGQVNKRSTIGISRIWVAPKWRRFGLARHLLHAVLTHLVYGMVLDKHQVAFSQPSYSGGLLAKNFNGVTHKSGDVLVPVYLED